MNEQSTRHQGLESCFSLDAPSLRMVNESSKLFFWSISKEIALAQQFARVQKYESFQAKHPFAVRANASSRRKPPNMDLKPQFSRGK